MATLKKTSPLDRFVARTAREKRPASAPNGPDGDATGTVSPSPAPASAGLVDYPSDEEMLSDADSEYAPPGVTSSRPKFGKGSHDPYAQLLTAAELWPERNGKPAMLDPAEWKKCKIPAQGDLMYQVLQKGRAAAGVPEWVQFTEHGMFCVVCRRSGKDCTAKNTA